MHKSIQRVLKRIKENGLDDDTVLGDCVADILFSDCAIFIDEQCRVFLLQSLSNKGSDVNGFILGDLVSTLRKLEDSMLIYVIGKEPSLPLLYYSAKTQCAKTQFENRYDIGNGMILRQEDVTACIEKDGTVIASGSMLPSRLGDVVASYLTATAYPSEGLKDYIKRGFQTEESYLAKRANRISIASVVLAIIIAVSAPFITVWWSNTHGKTTIVEPQFEGILKAASQPILRDTVYINNSVSEKQQTTIHNTNNKE